VRISSRMIDLIASGLHKLRAERAENKNNYDRLKKQVIK
jgi:hypothetical protein